MSYSLTYVGNIVAIVMILSKVLDVDLDEGQVTEAVVGLATFAGFLLSLYGRYRHGDVTWFGLKIK